MAKITLILISQEIFGINVRQLSAALRRRGHEPYLFFVTDKLDDKLAEQIAREAASLAPDAVGLSVMSDVSADAANLTRALRNHVQAPVLWGGVHTSVAPAQSLESADYIFLGEADETLPEFLDRFKAGETYAADGVYSRWDPPSITRAFSSPVNDLDALAHPCLSWDRHFIFRGGEALTGRLAEEKLLAWTYHTMMSRGCPFNCAYCYNNYLRTAVKNKGRYLRNKSIPAIISELAAAAQAFSNLKRVFFWDDNFLSRNLDEIQAFASKYKKEINLPFGMLGNPENVTPQKLVVLQDAGMDYFQMGLQSGSESVNRDIYKRPVSMEKFLAAAGALSQLKVREIRYDLIFNNPYETAGQIKESILTLLQIPRPYIFNGFNLVFFPGTKLYEMALADGLIEPNSGPAQGHGTLFAMKNSPLHFPLSHRFPDLLYNVKYGEGAKRYYNLLVFLTVCTGAPRRWIVFLLRNENFLTRPLPALLARSILAARALKARLRRRPRTTANE